jgi:hypothetical protein
MHYVSTSQPITYTRDGNIPALRFRDANGQKYWIVPKTKRMDDESTVEPLVLVRDAQGRIVYALPGGGSYVEDASEAP